MNISLLLIKIVGLLFQVIFKITLVLYLDKRYVITLPDDIVFRVTHV